MSHPLEEHLQSYLDKPSAATFLQLRDTVAKLPGYAPYANRLNLAYELLEQEKLDEARDYLMSLLPDWLLNPGIHHLLSFVHHKLGDDRAARFEGAMAQVMLQGILSTGDGSEAQPYLVLRTADEYDVLRHLGKQPRQQSLVAKDERHYDRHDCDDGSEIWFDVTVQLARLGAERRNSP